MKLHRLFRLSVFVVGLSIQAFSAESDPLAEMLFPPDLILHSGEAIGLSDEQRTGTISAVEKASARFAELDKALEKERIALIALLKNADPDSAKIKEKIDSMTSVERDLRRAQLALLLSLRSSLTPDQRARLLKLRSSHNSGALEERLKDKLSEVEQSLQKLALNGGDPNPIAERMQKFPELMQVGKVQEAERLLDQILKELAAK